MRSPALLWQRMWKAVDQLLVVGIGIEALDMDVDQISRSALAALSDFVSP